LSGKKSREREGALEYWNAGISSLKAIIPLIQYSIIPMAFSGGIFNGS
jgi:hypothetical protein